MEIKRFKKFNEEISGTEMVGKYTGPNYPEQDNTNSTIGSRHTDILYSPISSKLYTYDDYQDIYQNYLKLGGKPLNGFTEENLTTILTYNS